MFVVKGEQSSPCRAAAHGEPIERQPLTIDR